MKNLIYSLIAMIAIINLSGCKSKTSNKNNSDKDSLSIECNVSELIDTQTRTMMVLDSLEGIWNIICINEQSYSKDSCATIVFNTKEKKFYTDAGCNQIQGEIAQIARTADAFSFVNVLSTQMICPDDKKEIALKDAINKTCSFYAIGGNVYFADQEDKTLLICSKSE